MCGMSNIELYTLHEYILMMCVGVHVLLLVFASKPQDQNMLKCIPFPDLKTGHVDHLLLDYFSRKFYDNCIFLR